MPIIILEVCEILWNSNLITSPSTACQESQRSLPTYQHAHAWRSREEAATVARRRRPSPGCWPLGLGFGAISVRIWRWFFFCFAARCPITVLLVCVSATRALFDFLYVYSTSIIMSGIMSGMCLWLVFYNGMSPSLPARWLIDSGVPLCIDGKLAYINIRLDLYHRWLLV